MNFEWFLDEVVLALRDAASRSSVDDFLVLFGVGVLIWVYFGLVPKLEVPLKLAALPFLGRGLPRIRSRRLGGRAVGGRGSCRYRASPK